MTTRSSQDNPPPSVAWTTADISTDLVWGVFGAQHERDLPIEFLRIAKEFFPTGNEIAHVDLGKFVDRANWKNLVVIAYWEGPAQYEDWLVRSGFQSWWERSANTAAEHGYFRELMRVVPLRSERMYSSPTPEGFAHRRDAQPLISPVVKRNYFGAMRDRLPIAATDRLDAPTRRRRASENINRVRIPGCRSISPWANMAWIRSGHDWSVCPPSHRDFYVDTLEAKLAAGTRYLVDHPSEAACCDCRYVLEIDAAGNDLPRSCGLALFESLADLERWSSSAPSHLEIYNTFRKWQRDKPMTLRLSHESAILPADSAPFEYINCHAETGLLPYS